MKLSKILLLAILLGIESEIALAEDVTPITTDKMSLVQDAEVVDANSVRLTPNSTAKTGVVVLPKLCAKEYKLRFDLNAGSGSGAGFVIDKMLEARISPQVGPMRERDFENFLPTGELAKLARIHFDTYRDFLRYENGQAVLQRDDNSVYMHRIEKVSDNSISFVSLVDQSLPFRMKGNGWFTVQLHNVGDLIKLSVIKDGLVVLEKEGLASPAAGKEHQVSILAWTGVAASEQQVRNVSLEIIEPDDCRLPLTDNQLAEELASACGVSTTSCNEECYLATMQPLLANGKITDAQIQSMLLECSAQTCEAEQPEPVDLESIRHQAFAEGVASVNLSTACEPIRQQAYAAGVASVNLSGEKQKSYNEGYEAGKKEGQKVTICHKEKKKGNGVYKTTQNTLTVSINALSAHLAHGDSIGACTAATKPAKK